MQQQTKKQTNMKSTLIGFLAEGAALRKLGTATGGGAEDGVARGAEDDGVGVGEDGGDAHAAGALDVHEVGVGRLDKTFLLVGSLLLGDGGVEEVVLDERHFCFFYFFFKELC